MQDLCTTLRFSPYYQGYFHDLHDQGVIDLYRCDQGDRFCFNLQIKENLSLLIFDCVVCRLIL